jgi:hypothetical protein
MIGIASGSPFASFASEREIMGLIDIKQLSPVENVDDKTAVANRDRNLGYAIKHWFPEFQEVEIEKPFIAFIPARIESKPEAVEQAMKKGLTKLDLMREFLASVREYRNIIYEMLSGSSSEHPMNVLGAEISANKELYDLAFDIALRAICKYPTPAMTVDPKTRAVTFDQGASIKDYIARELTSNQLIQRKLRVSEKKGDIADLYHSYLSDTGDRDVANTRADFFVNKLQSAPKYLLFGFPANTGAEFINAYYQNLLLLKSEIDDPWLFEERSFEKLPPLSQKVLLPFIQATIYRDLDNSRIFDEMIERLNAEMKTQKIQPLYIGATRQVRAINFPPVTQAVIRPAVISTIPDKINYMLGIISRILHVNILLLARSEVHSQKTSLKGSQEEKKYREYVYPENKTTIVLLSFKNPDTGIHNYELIGYLNTPDDDDRRIVETQFIFSDQLRRDMHRIMEM